MMMLVMAFQRRSLQDREIESKSQNEDRCSLRLDVDTIQIPTNNYKRFIYTYHM